MVFDGKPKGGVAQFCGLQAWLAARDSALDPTTLLDESRAKASISEGMGSRPKRAKGTEACNGPLPMFDRRLCFCGSESSCVLLSRAWSDKEPSSISPSPDSALFI